MEGAWLEQLPDISFFDLVHLVRSSAVARAPARIGFASHPGLGHARRDVESVRAGDAVRGERAVQIAVNFFGLLGVSSPLPANLLDELGRLPRDSLASLLIRIVDHHLLTGLYRQWWGVQPQNPSWVRLRSSLRGMDRSGPANECVPFWYGGCGSAAAIRALLADSLPGVRVEVRQWLPRPVPLGRRQTARCGAVLGRALGRRITVRNACAQIHLHNIGMSQWYSLLPGGIAWTLLRTIKCRLLPELPLLEVCLHPAEVNEAYRRCGAARGRLGHSLWLGGETASPATLHFG